MAKKKKRVVKPWCWYCDREFEDEQVLLQHQRLKHFKCGICRHKMMQVASGLVFHYRNVHNQVLQKIPNALPGRDTVTLEIFGMDGVPERDLREREAKVLGELEQQQQQSKRARVSGDAASGSSVVAPASSGAAAPASSAAPVSLKAVPATSSSSTMSSSATAAATTIVAPPLPGVLAAPPVIVAPRLPGAIVAPPVIVAPRLPGAVVAPPAMVAPPLYVGSYAAPPSMPLYPPVAYPHAVTGNVPPAPALSGAAVTTVPSAKVLPMPAATNHVAGTTAEHEVSDSAPLATAQHATTAAPTTTTSIVISAAPTTVTASATEKAEPSFPRPPHLIYSDESMSIEERRAQIARYRWTRREAGEERDVE